MRYLPRYLNPGLQMDAQCERPRRGQNCMWREMVGLEGKERCGLWFVGEDKSVGLCVGVRKKSRPTNFLPMHGCSHRSLE